MKNRSLVITLTVAYAGLVCGAIVLGSPANLLGSTLNFFTEPAKIEQLESFDANNDATPDFMNAERILEVFVSAPQWLTPLLGQPFMMPGMIRIDEHFFTMPGDHTAAPVVSTEENDPVFEMVEPLWTSDTIELSPQFEGGKIPDADVGTPFLVPTVRPSSSLPASFMMPTAPTTPASTPPAVTASPASNPPVTSAPTAVVPATATSTSSSVSTVSSSLSTSSSSSFAVATEICTNGMDDDSDGADDCDDMDCMADPSCMSSSSLSTTASVETQCGDGNDNDTDGSKDCEDADCMAYPACMASTFSSSEGF